MGAAADTADGSDSADATIGGSEAGSGAAPRIIAPISSQCIHYCIDPAGCLCSTSNESLTSKSQAGNQRSR